MRKLAALLVITAFLVMSINLFAQEAKKAEAPKFKYVGVSKCKMCHKGEKNGNVFEKWEASSHAKAYATLATDQSKEIAKKAGVKGEPQQATECLACHVTGALSMAEQKEASLTLEEGISCEACHGAGSEYKSLKIMKDISADKVKLADFGLIEPTKEVCIKCHNSKSPTYKEFKFDEAVKLIAHPLPKSSD